MCLCHLNYRHRPYLCHLLRSIQSLVYDRLSVMTFAYLNSFYALSLFPHSITLSTLYHSFYTLSLFLQSITLSKIYHSFFPCSITLSFYALSLFLYSITLSILCNNFNHSLTSSVSLTFLLGTVTALVSRVVEQSILTPMIRGSTPIKAKILLGHT